MVANGLSSHAVRNSRSRTAILLAPMLLALVLLALPGALRPARAGSFTPEQRAEIIAIVRDALKQDPSILRDAADAMQADQAQQQAEAARAAIAANHDALYDEADPGVRSPQATVTIVEFFDPRCPYCRQVDPMLSLWLQHDPSVQIIYKDLPILGPPSVLGSRALLAAQRQGAYVKFRDALMNAPPDIDEALLQDIAGRLGLDWARMQADMNDPAIQQRLDANMVLAKAIGIDGTPGFVVGDRLVLGSELTDVQAAVAAARPK